MKKEQAAHQKIDEKKSISEKEHEDITIKEVKMIAPNRTELKSKVTAGIRKIKPPRE